jgi:SP family sugar:H+ symporter-like MFS transporter
MERFGRRWPLIIGGLWQAAWLFAYASVGVIYDTNSKGTGSFLIAAAALFIFGYASTWAPGIWILTGESFPTRTRQKQASLAVAANWTFVSPPCLFSIPDSHWRLVLMRIPQNFLLAFFTPFITSAIDYAYG